MTKNYYEELGVPPDAEPGAIKQAFRLVAHKCHPDVSRAEGGAERFKRARAAYEVLSDPVRRAEYDAQLAQMEHVTPVFVSRMDTPDLDGARAWPGIRDAFEMLEEVTPEFFEGLWRDLGFEPDDPFEESLSAEVELTRREAEEGCEVPVEAPVETVCERCDGTGRRRGSVCARCEGTGAREVLLRTTLRIPPGVRDGDRVTVALRAEGLEDLRVSLRITISGPSTGRPRRGRQK